MTAADADDVLSAEAAAQTMKLFAMRPPSRGAAPAAAAGQSRSGSARRRRTVSPSARRVTPRRACNMPATPRAPSALELQRCAAPRSGTIPLLPLSCAAAPAGIGGVGGVGTQYHPLPSSAAAPPTPLQFPSRAVLAAAAGPPGAVWPRPGEAPPALRLLAIFRATTWAGAPVLRRSATQAPHLACAFAWPGLP